MEPSYQAGAGLLRPGSTCWRVEHARHIALLVDGAAYIPAMKAAVAKARHSVLLLGWDFDPRVPLEPDLEPGGQSDRLCDLLEGLLARRPGLRAHILIWDMALPYAIHRGDRPQRAGRRLPNDRLIYRVDGVHPRGACHHQKVLVIDDAIAFCGGGDFSRNRWDTPEHLPWDRRRLNADGRVYGPRHDVELAVDGAAASALGDLCRERWRRATGVQLEAAPVQNDRASDWARSSRIRLAHHQAGGHRCVLSPNQSTSSPKGDRHCGLITQLSSRGSI